MKKNPPTISHAALRRIMESARLPTPAEVAFAQQSAAALGTIAARNAAAHITRRGQLLKP